MNRYIIEILSPSNKNKVLIQTIETIYSIQELTYDIEQKAQILIQEFNSLKLPKSRTKVITEVLYGIVNDPYKLTTEQQSRKNQLLWGYGNDYDRFICKEKYGTYSIRPFISPSFSGIDVSLIYVPPHKIYTLDEWFENNKFNKDVPVIVNDGTCDFNL